MKKHFSSLIAISIFSISSFTAFDVYACDLNSGGFLAAVTECVIPESAPIVKELDRLNGELGQPVDHAIAVGADVFIPGAGAVLEGGWELQRSRVLPEVTFPPFISECDLVACEPIPHAFWYELPGLILN